MHFMQDPDITNLEWRFEGMRIRGGGNGKRLFWKNWSHYELRKNKTQIKSSYFCLTFSITTNRAQMPWLVFAKYLRGNSQFPVL
jgi:hypothetical protein